VQEPATISPARRAEVIDALRRGTVPQAGLDLFAVGMERFERAANRPFRAPAPDLQLDYVGSVENAAKVIAALHRGQKRLVFADSKRLMEMLGAELRERGVTMLFLALDEEQSLIAAGCCLPGGAASSVRLHLSPSLAGQKAC
jgi:P-loop Domain of unknown function (DUF2791)